MKILISIITLGFLLTSCQNENFSFPDYDYNAVYFPIQYPLRTLVLGDSRSDNNLDKKLQFHIGVSIGGLYENKRDWKVSYKVDYSLVPPNLVDQDGDTIRVLPEKYYSLSPAETVTIPSGSFNGLILVQLTDAFLDDSLSVAGDYVIPLSITRSDADSILSGVPYVPNPNKNIPGDWNPDAQPKDFVLFGIKYINPYHGTYFHRGKDVKLDVHGDTVAINIYRQQYVVKDQLWQLTTTGRNTVETNGVGAQFNADTRLELKIDSDGVIQIRSKASSLYPASGVGRFVKDAAYWGGVKHNALYLNYIYTEGSFSHVVTDTLVFRNNGVVYEENQVSLE